MRSPAAVALIVAGCGARQAPATTQHTGWTLQYTQRVGQGPSDPRDVRPDVSFEILDGIARIRVPERGLEGHIDHVHQRAQLCRAGACTPTDFHEALVSLCCNERVPALTGEEEAPTVDTLNDPQTIANVPTSGARFRSVVHVPGGAIGVTVTVRWIEQPGDPSIEVAKDWFVAPLEQFGASRLAAQIRARAGLPLHWEARITNARADGSSDEGAVVYHAAQLANAPAAVPAP